MESDLISRAALLAEYDQVHVGAPGGARKLIAEAPAVDAVEVVRCKDCKHFDDGECTMLSEPKERREYERWVTIVAEDDFCSCGEQEG